MSIEINPNVTTGTTTTVEITLGAWKYRSKHLVEVCGNVLGFSVIEAAVRNLEDEIERHFSEVLGYHQDECIFMYDGDDQLELSLSEQDRFEDLVVSAVIVKQEG